MDSRDSGGGARDAPAGREKSQETALGNWETHTEEAQASIKFKNKGKREGRNERLPWFSLTMSSIFLSGVDLSSSMPESFDPKEILCFFSFHFFT